MFPLGKTTKTIILSSSEVKKHFTATLIRFPSHLIYYKLPSMNVPMTVLFVTYKMKFVILLALIGMYVQFLSVCIGFN